MEMDVRVMNTKVPGPCEHCGNHVEDCASECSKCSPGKPQSLCEHPSCIQCHTRLQAKRRAQQLSAAAGAGGSEVLTKGDLKEAVEKIEKA
eukprot:CAMPEP_0169456828 /NCGR_PEP_ID=MMETSP1042-20121227/16556_1 /TAXON_ID=464988 /ORGANISM="Hemiselmis andersenii, Strain CCMP1180" /LENGTH=90 /DNA_ID=CAMNT_0009569067 /DNA_START=38 /DNA_END=306 /DNA_ORIENTATION=+